MHFSVRTIAGALAAALITVPVFAQTPPAAPPKEITDFDDLSTEQQDEVYCVYDAIGSDKDADVLEDLLIYGDQKQEAAANAVFDRAEAACATKHKWTSDQKEVAGVVARAGVIADLTEGELRGEGFDDKKLEAMMAVSKKMTPADFQALLEMAYGKKADEAFITKMKGLLYEVGVSKEHDIADLAIDFLGASLQERDAIFVWVDQQLY